MLGRHGFMRLLQAPWDRGVHRDVGMRNPARRVFHESKDVEEAKGCYDHHAEVAGDHCMGMVTLKDPPALRRDTCVRPAVPMGWQVCAHGAWRHAHAEREQELIGDLLLAPRWVVTGYATDECSQIRRKWRSSGCEFPPPAQAEPLAMPLDQGRRLYDGQGLSAGEPAGQ
jgi:hypothetical protein